MIKSTLKNYSECEFEESMPPQNKKEQGISDITMCLRVNEQYYN